MILLQYKICSFLLMSTPKLTLLLKMSQLNSFIPPIEKTLYIWDESHFGQTKGQAVSMFLKKCNLVPGRKGQNGNFLLSVSATPFSELHNIDPYNIIWRKNPKNCY